MHPTSRILVLAASLTLYSVTCAAATPAGERNMTLDELRVCVALEHETRDLQDEFERVKQRYEQAEHAHRMQDHLVVSLRGTLDTRDGRAVDDFNLKVREQNRLLDEFNALVEPYNAKLEALQTAAARMQAECRGKYRESDKRIILQEREAALREQLEAEGRR